MSQKVFLSYASQDRAFAESLKARLDEVLSEHSQAHDVFDVQSSIGGGENIRDAIQSAMHEASTVVIVSSPASDASPWVSYEAGLADALGKNVVIVGRRGAGKSDLLKRLSDTARFVEVDYTG
jgi:ABC-type polysaccharide/polyol phosphate transport system ATPase subunit